MADPNAGRIVRLEIDNVKRLKAVRVTPEGSLIVVAGKNDQGKSSVLDSIRFALGGPTAMKDTPEVVRRGEIAAKVVAEFEDITVTRTVLDGKQAVVVESKDGARFKSPQALLDSLVGSLSFDPLAFARQKPADQRRVLLELAGLNFEPLDGDRARLYEARTIVGRERDRVKGSLESYPREVTDQEPIEEKSATQLLDEIQEARALNNRRALLEGDIAERRNRIATLDAEIARLRAQRAEIIEGGNEAHAKLVALPPAVDVEPLTRQLDDIEQRNELARAQRQYHETRGRYQELVAEYDNGTAKINAIDAEKQRMIREASLPVAGLGVDDDGVTFDGIPLSQASESQRIKTSVAIQMALNPSVRVMLIDNGNALDADNLALLQSMAEEHDYQIWMTWVGESERAQVVIEDGEARA